ncbi:hypothetical protein, partial [Aeromonas sp. HMWF014]|uniref:hypothetical protein n=1 Tax=Aeromonas sp. HMWF014 TaxID=2056850 RepID=UPI0015E80720
TWYLDHDAGNTYSLILETHIQHYEPRDVFFFGSSMSGYASILFSLKFNANSISVNPQINLNISKDYSWEELKQHIENIPGDIINIDEWCIKNWKDSVVYLMHGHDDIDVINTKIFLNAMPSRRKVIIQTIGLDSHTMFFGKNVNQVYDILELVSLYRGIADQEIESAGMTDELKRKAIRRQKRNELGLYDPYRDIPIDDRVTWQQRYLYEDPGKVIFFKDVGLYSLDGYLSGAICQFDGKQWKLISPKPSLNDNIISDWSFVNDTTISNPVDNQTITQQTWWVRNNCSSDINIVCGDGIASINITKANSKNIYIGLSLNKLHLDKEIYSHIERKYLTFSADLSSTNGPVNLVLGGVSNDGYHHCNSNPHNKIGFSSKFVFEQFFDINKNHKEPIFVRINLCPDGKEKTVKIKNIKLVIGYFPMGF